MKTKILIGILVFLIIVNLATIGAYLYVRAARPEGDAALISAQHGPRGRGPLPDLLGQLSSDQRGRLNELMSGFHDETHLLHDQVRDLEESMFRLLHQDPVPSDSIELMLRRMADLRLEISRKAIQRLVAAKVFLAPGQQDILFDAIMTARPEIGGPPPRGEGMPPGPPVGQGRPPRPRPDDRP